MNILQRLLQSVLYPMLLAALTCLLAFLAIYFLPLAGCASRASAQEAHDASSVGSAPRLAAIDWEEEITVPLSTTPKAHPASHDATVPKNTENARPSTIHRDLTGTVTSAGTSHGAFATDDGSIYSFETCAPAADILYSVCPVGSRCRFTAEVVIRDAATGEYWLERILAIENLDQADSAVMPKDPSPRLPDKGISLTERNPTPASSPAAVPAQRVQPSFDCAKATTLVERLICDDTELSAYDAQMAQEYAAVMRSNPRASLWKKAHVKWFHEQRNTCQDAACLRQAYRHWISALQEAALE